MENNKGKFWLLVSWIKGICLPASVPPSSPTKGRWGPETGQGTHRERERGSCQPHLETLAQCWVVTEMGRSLCPSLWVLLPSHKRCLPSTSYTWKRNLSLSMGLPWMSRVSAFCSSWSVMVPLPSESNRTKNLSAKKDCGRRRTGDGYKLAMEPGLGIHSLCVCVCVCVCVCACTHAVGW